MKTNVLLFMAGEFVCGIYVATGFFNQVVLMLLILKLKFRTS